MLSHPLPPSPCPFHCPPSYTTLPEPGVQALGFLLSSLSRNNSPHNQTSKKPGGP